MTSADGAFPLDEDGLLCALVLVPSTYSRNRFFRLYEQPAMRAVQRRARIVRGLARQLLRASDGFRSVVRRPAGGVEVEIVVPSLGYRRRSLLTEMEYDLLLYLVNRIGRGADPEAAAARTRVEGALERLSGLAGPLMAS